MVVGLVVIIELLGQFVKLVVELGQFVKLVEQLAAAEFSVCLIAQ